MESFKIGDRVYLCFNECDDIEEIGVIKEKYGGCWLVKLDIGACAGEELWIVESDLRLVE